MSAIGTHDWSRVPAGLYHDFHQSWAVKLSGRLNASVLPQGYYSLVTRDVFPGTEAEGAILGESDLAAYARLANAITVYSEPDDAGVATIEIVSPGNKWCRAAVEDFRKKVLSRFERGQSLLVVDPLPLTDSAPGGLHAAIWDRRFGIAGTTVSDDRPICLVSYRAEPVGGGYVPEAYFSKVPFGEPLPRMPLMLTPERAVMVPLGESYADAWETTPGRVKDLVHAAL